MMSISYQRAESSLVLCSGSSLAVFNLFETKFSLMPKLKNKDIASKEDFINSFDDFFLLRKQLTEPKDINFFLSTVVFLRQFFCSVLLLHVADVPDNEEPITPNHFLMQRPCNSLPPGDFSSTMPASFKSWKNVTGGYTLQACNATNLATGFEMGHTATWEIT